MALDIRVMAMDVRYFFLAYALAIAAALVPGDLRLLRYVAVIALLGLYANYVRRHFESDHSVDAADLAPLRFQRADRRPYRDPSGAPRLRIVSLQVLVALAMIVIGAAVFVDGVQRVSLDFGLDAALLALVIAPIATELPEKFNSLIWVRQGKDTLAMGNITGAMVFQSCIPTAIAIVLASDAWTISGANLLTFASAGIAFASMFAIFLPMARRGSLAGNAPPRRRAVLPGLCRTRGQPTGRPVVSSECHAACLNS